MADSSLSAIQTKVRRLTRSPSVSQLSDTQLNEYINTFIQFDLPEQLRLFNLQKTFSFYTKPCVDTYATSTVVTDPMYDFKNKYITTQQPVYVAGRQVQFLESREQFYGQFPKTISIRSIGTAGNGVQTVFAGFVSTSAALVLSNNVLFSSIGANNVGLSMIDYPISSAIGNLYVPGGAPTSTVAQDPVNYINYTTGQFVVTFPTAPAAGKVINSQVVLTQPSIPLAVLFFDGAFTLRPIPDQVYKVEMEVFVQPTELLAAGDFPDLKEWFQYIAYGASIKIFQDRMDLESVQQIRPEFKTPERLINRRTVVQLSSQRAPTIFDGTNTVNTNLSGIFGQGWF